MLVLRGTDFWSDSGGTGLYWLKYEMAAAAIRKINLESPGFYKAFNQQYYSLINANPTRVRPTRALIIGVIKGLVPQIEGLPADQWINQQNIFYCQNVYGEKIYHRIQDYQWTEFFAFQSLYFLNTMPCGSEWTCWNGSQWVYYDLNGSQGAGDLIDSHGNTIWTGSLSIQPSQNPSNGYYAFGSAPMGLTTASTLQPWPGGDPTTYIMNLDTLGLYKFDSSFTDSTTGTTTTDNVYRVMGSQIANNFSGVWGGVLGHQNGTIYLDHEGLAPEPGIPMVNGAFVDTRSWTGIPDARTGGTDSLPGRVFITFTDAGVTYHAQRNIDYGSSAGSQMFLFDFSVPPADIIPPTVSVASPSANASVFGTVTLVASAADNVGVAGVQFAVDGQNVGPQQTSAPYTMNWDSTTLGDGSHNITAAAWDLAGNTALSNPVTVVVDNSAPTVSLTSPSNGSVVTGIVPIAASASPLVSQVGFYLDGTTLIGTATSAPYGVNWNTSTLVQGSSHTVSAVAYGVNGKTATSAATVTVQDTTPPTVALTNPLANAIVFGTVTLVANATDNVGVARVQFAVDGQNVGGQQTSSPYTMTWNSTTVADGSHNITAVAWDSAGNTGVSTPTMVLVDNSAPTVSLTAPSNGSLVTGIVAVTATASALVSQVGFYLDGTTLIGRAVSAPYGVSWNTSGLVQGSSHTVSAVAYGINGKTVTSAVTVAIKDTTPPTVAITSPANNASVSGTVTISASALDNVGIARVEFYLDGGLLTTAISSPYAASWNTNTASLGTHTLSAQAYDRANNSTTSAAVSVKVVDTTAPTVAITSPANGSYVTRSTTITISATASDNRSVQKVLFYVNNVLRCTDTIAPYSCNWSVPPQKGVQYSLKATAYDASNNTATATSVVTSK